MLSLWLLRCSWPDVRGICHVPSEISYIANILFPGYQRMPFKFIILLHLILTRSNCFLACKDFFCSDQSKPLTYLVQQSGDGGLYAER